jgi:NAD(P)-dependent dehydrogenase (short-subunit alcohol dehydrogenase family)
MFAVTVNVTKEASVTAAVDQIVSSAGALHGMVVNASRTNNKSALEFMQEEIEGLFAVNLFGAFYCACVAARTFIAQNVKGAGVGGAHVHLLSDAASYTTGH